MRQKTFWIAASCILAVIGLRPAFSSGAAPASTEKVIYSFTGGADGGQPMSDLTIDAAGNLYGTTSQGGVGCNGYGCGTVFELKRTKDGWKEDVLYSFTGASDGEGPQAGVIFDNVGNLYGTTVAGGSNGGGTVFKLEPNSRHGWTESILHSFTLVSGDGSRPQTDLVFDTQGNAYGATLWGGSAGQSCHGFGCGVVFELTPHAKGAWTETILHVFAGAPDGATPSSSVVLDSAGNLYGMTAYGGAGPCNINGPRDAPVPGCGAVYELMHKTDGGWTETVVYSFVRGGGSAVTPSGGLILDNVGRLIGTSFAGGDRWGAVFELDQSRRGWDQSVLHRFYGNPDGIQPMGRLWTDAHGDLFGVTISGGANRVNGTVFELEPTKAGDWRERLLHAFGSGSDGMSPQAGLVSDSEGHLFGTTPQGGGSGCYGGTGCGTVYEVTP